MLVTSNPIGVRLAVLMCAAVIFASGCGSGRGELYPALARPLVWPQAPEKPRVRYLGQFRSEDDLKKEVSSFESLGRIIFGRNEIGVFARPHAVVAHNDKLYVADSSGAVIHVLDFNTRKYVQFSKLTETERLNSPIALTMAEDRLYVADSILHKVCVFDEQANCVFSFGADILQRPSGLACSPQQRKLYVADARLHTVEVFDLQGRHLGRLGGQIQELRFNFPTQLWIGCDDKLYVSDTLNYRIQVFNLDGTYLGSIGQHGNRPGYFAHPTGVATDSFGNIYVSDKQFENIQIFNAAGQVLMSFGDEGNQPGEFWLPAGLFIDGQNRIYVADSFNQRIQVFQLLEGQSQ